MGTISDKIQYVRQKDLVCACILIRLSIEFVRCISRIYPTFCARVFLSDLEYNLSDV